jgi:nucleotide-binding universal stress UspA family protein
MSYKTILVHAGEDPNANARVSLALNLGRLFKGVTMGVGSDPSNFLAQADMARALVLWRAESGEPLHAMIKHARGADLIVAIPKSERTEQPDPVGLIFETGVPVLLAPEGMDGLHPRAVAVGWKNTPGTRRAIVDALPFLQAAERTILIALAEDTGAAPDRSEIEAVADRLGRHGVRCDVLTPSPTGASVAQQLADMADCCGAGLLVAGAFARSTWRERLFGGVTRDLLSGPSMPVLFSR